MSDKKSPATLAFEDHFPLLEKNYSEPFSALQINDLSLPALDTLKAVIALEQVNSDYQDTDKKVVGGELHRIEQKVDFITELLVKVLQAQQDIPAKTSIIMNAKSISWVTESKLEEGSFCVLSIHFSHKFPMPLEIPIQVINSNKKIGTEFGIEGQILFTDENLNDEMTRLIFLYHRRQIARNRS